MKQSEINWCKVYEVMEGRKVKPVFSIEKLLLIMITFMILGLITVQVAR